jgi:hypothetical protein
MVLDLHRKAVQQNRPYCDARLSLLPRLVSLLFLKLYRRRFKPTKISRSEIPKEKPTLTLPLG